MLLSGLGAKSRSRHQLRPVCSKPERERLPAPSNPSVLRAEDSELGAAPPSCPDPPQPLSPAGEPEKYAAEAAFLKVDCSVQLPFPREQKGGRETRHRGCVRVCPCEATCSGRKSRYSALQARTNQGWRRAAIAAPWFSQCEELSAPRASGEDRGRRRGPGLRVSPSPQIVWLLWLERNRRRKEPGLPHVSLRPLEGDSSLDGKRLLNPLCYRRRKRARAHTHTRTLGATLTRPPRAHTSRLRSPMPQNGGGGSASWKRCESGKTGAGPRKLQGRR